MIFQMNVFALYRSGAAYWTIFFLYKCLTQHTVWASGYLVSKSEHHGYTILFRKKLRVREGLSVGMGMCWWKIGLVTKY